MTRFRDLGFDPGTMPTGVHNAITDVAGVKVGHATLIEGDSIRTGVTVILPNDDGYTHKVPAAVYTINGFGKATAFEQTRELGIIETPIALTSTLNVGRVWDALVSYVIGQHPGALSINPVVGECNDSFLNDMAGRHVGQSHVFAAIESAAGGAVREGCVGAAMGTTCFGFKGGIGTASRLVDPRAGEDQPTFTVGALLQTNFGAREELRVMGVPVGMHFLDELLPTSGAEPGEDGSVMIVLATDAPLDARQLTRLAKRAAFGLARTGSISHDGSGDFVIAFSTAQPVTMDDPMLTTTTRIHEKRLVNRLFRAVVESVEESVYNALVAAQTITGRDGNTLHALPHDRLRDLLQRYSRG